MIPTAMCRFCDLPYDYCNNPDCKSKHTMVTRTGVCLLCKGQRCQNITGHDGPCSDKYEPHRGGYCLKVLPAYDIGEYSPDNMTEEDLGKVLDKLDDMVLRSLRSPLCVI